MSTPPPGWYDDGRGATRWWDGVQWSAHVQPPDAPADDGAADIAALTGPPAGAASSRWWIWAAVGGVVLVGLIVAAVVLVPLALRGVSGNVEGSTPDERAAVDAIEKYDQAWTTIDCPLFESVTTAAYREFIQVADCAAFEDRAAGLVATTTEYTTRVTSVETEDDGTIEVETAETYRERQDGDSTGPVVTDEYTYTLVSTGGAWVIDEAELQ